MVRRSKKKADRGRNHARKGIDGSVFGRAVVERVQKDVTKHHYPGVTFGEEGEREKDAKIERSMVRGVVGEDRGPVPKHVSREVGEGVE
jgi:hypothetical protein